MTERAWAAPGDADCRPALPSPLFRIALVNSPTNLESHPDSAIPMSAKIQFVVKNGRPFLFLLSFLQAFHLQSAVPGDEHWDNQFGPVGANDFVPAIATIGSTVYIGGGFTAAGNQRVNLIASYDGTNWSRLGSGMTFATSISVLAADGTNLYAGGGFDKADGIDAKSIARWDGASWYAVGGGVSGFVLAIKIVGTNLYAGGIFSTAGGVTVNHVARWNGSAWSPLGTGVAGSGLPPTIVNIDSDGTNVYVCGLFTSAGGVNATNIARWNGTSWSALPGLVGNVSTLLVKDGKLYAGGNFTNTSISATNLAIWNGASWSAWANPGRVRDIFARGPDIYVSGDFTNVAGVAANRIVRWDGTNWFPLGTGVQGFGIGSQPVGVRRIAFDTSGRLYAAGVFNIAGSVGASHVAGWDSTNWFALGGATSKGVTHFDRRVQSLLTVGTNIYAGGIFTEAGDVIVNGIARWNGSRWSALGSGMLGSGGVFALAESAGLLYAGGSFTNMGGILSRRVAVWNGTNWAPLGSGLNGSVNALLVFRGTLFAGGSFTARGDNSGALHGIAQWDGIDWQDVPTISAWRINNVFNALATDGTNLFAGGNYYIGWQTPPPVVTGQDLDNIGRWDGTNWWEMGVGVGLNATISALAVQNGALYVGGAFTNPAVPSIQRIARWDGSAWSGLGPGFTNGSVLALAATPTTVYAAGTFTNGGAPPANQMARWNGANWSALGSGFTMSPATPVAQALTTISNDVYVGGLFMSAGDKPAMFLSRWNDQMNFYPPPHPELTRHGTTTNSQFRFRLIGTSGETYVIQASTNLSTWTPVLTNSVMFYEYTDSLAPSFPRRFYRAMLPPPP
jgi:hypothetical protein